MNSKNDFQIDPVDWQKEVPELRRLLGAESSSGTGDHDRKVNQALAEIAVHAWRSERRMKDRLTGEVKDEHRATHRGIAGILDTLQGLGFEVRDREGEVYDYGLPEKVVAAEKRAGLTRELVAETIRPSIFVDGRLAWAGEIVIAVPETDPGQ